MAASSFTNVTRVAQYRFAAYFASSDSRAEHVTIRPGNTSVNLSLKNTVERGSPPRIMYGTSAGFCHECRRFSPMNSGAWQYNLPRPANSRSVVPGGTVDLNTTGTSGCSSHAAALT
jgi:hypothetical protein